MQSTENVIVAESSDKSLTEWPTLSDVCSNVKKPSPSPTVVKNGRNSKKSNKTPSETSGGYDSSKENEILPQCSNGRGARKKNSAKTKWVPVPIVPQPYKKRGNGRNFHGSMFGYFESKNESNEHINGQENGRGSVRGNNRFRGKRGRGYSHSWRPRRDETSRGELEHDSSDMTFDHPKLFYPSTVYYDPFMHGMFASALRAKELNKAIRQQIEYYFSDDNLVKDIFIRRKMDSNGYVPLSLISTFHRVQNLTESLDTIICALKDSSKLELAGAKVRPVINPLKWPIVDAFNGFRTDLPEFYPGRPYVNSLVEAIENLNFTDANGDSFPQSPSSSSSSPDQVCDFFTHGEQGINGIPFYPESISPPEHITDDVNYYTDSSVDPFVPDGIDYYSQTSSPDDHANGFDHYFSDQIPNGMIYYTPNASTSDNVANGESFYYGSSPDEVLSAATDNSVENQQEVDKLLEGCKSPEPPR